MNTLIIRAETPEDIPTIYEVNAAAFPENAEAELVNALRKTEAFIPALSLVAILDAQIVGHILFTKIEINNGEQSFESVALAPMAVLPRFQKQGIGSLLVKKGIDIASELGYSSVIVLGHEHYYPKFGFLPAAHWNILPPFDVPTTAFMALPLKKDGLKNVSGIVKYAAPFLAL